MLAALRASLVAFCVLFLSFSLSRSFVASSFVVALVTMTPFLFHPTIPLHFVVLWLLVIHVPFAKGVCHNCFWAAQGCSGTSDACPWVVGVAAIVAAMGAASGGALMLLTLLPSKILRLFPKSVLDILSRVAARDPASAFDTTNKSTSDIVKAVRPGHLSKVDAFSIFLILLKKQRMMRRKECRDPDQEVGGSNQVN